MRKLRFRCYTRTLTDVKTGGTIHFALMNKASIWVIQALDQALAALPLERKGIHSDTGSEFINNPVTAGANPTGPPSPQKRHFLCRAKALPHRPQDRRVFPLSGGSGGTARQAVYDAYTLLFNL